MAVLLKAAQDRLGVDEIAGAPKIDHAYLLAVRCAMGLKIFRGADDFTEIFSTS
jgi:hypothetical protein